MRAASGGEHWEYVKSLHYTFTTQAGGQTATSERWEDVATGRYAERASWPTYISKDGFDGITPWHQGRSGIAYTLGDVDSALVAADESFRVSRAWWFNDRHSATISVSGSRIEDGRRYDVLDVTPTGGRPFRAWVDRATHLLARTDEQQAEDRVVTTYADYRTVHNVVLPFTIRVGDGVDASSDAVKSIRSIDIGAAIPDGSFAIPPRPASGIELPPGRDRVDLPFRLTADDRILVPLTVGRRTLDAEFDSGGGLIVQPSELASMGINAAGKAREGGGGEGVSTSSSGRLGSVALGNARVRNLAFHSFAFAPDQRDRALVGLEILQRFVVRFDFDRRVMTLTRPEAFAYVGAGAVVPFHFQDNQPEVKGSVDGIAGLLTIDTGDRGSLLLLAPFARSYGLVERYHGDLPYDGRAVGTTHGVWARSRAHTVTFDGADGRPVAEVHDPITRISLQHAGFDANRNVSANIGLGILRQFNLTFDYARQRLILEPNHLYGQHEVFNRSGLLLSREGGAWKIDTVYPGTPAADAGLRPGDIVNAVDGRTAEALDPEALWSKLVAPAGTELALQLRLPQGAQRRVVLSLRDLL